MDKLLLSNPLSNLNSDNPSDSQATLQVKIRDMEQTLNIAGITRQIIDMTNQLDSNNKEIEKILQQKDQACTRIESIKGQLEGKKEQKSEAVVKTLDIMNKISKVIKGEEGEERIVDIVKEVEEVDKERAELISKVESLQTEKREKEEEDKKLQFAGVLQSATAGKFTNMQQTEIDRLKKEIEKKDAKIIEIGQEMDTRVQSMQNNMDAVALRAVRAQQRNLEEQRSLASELQSEINGLREKKQAESTLVANLKKELDNLKLKVTQQSELLRDKSSNEGDAPYGSDWIEKLGKGGGDGGDDFFERYQSAFESVPEAELEFNPEAEFNPEFSSITKDQSVTLLELIDNYIGNLSGGKITGSKTISQIVSEDDSLKPLTIPELPNSIMRGRENLKDMFLNPLNIFKKAEDLSEEWSADLLKLIMKQIGLPIVETEERTVVFNDKSALALLYLLLTRVNKEEARKRAENMDEQTWIGLTEIMIAKLKTIKNTDNTLTGPRFDNLKKILNKLFQKDETPLAESTKSTVGKLRTSGGKKRRSIKKKRQPKKNITIKKKYKKNKKLPKKKIKRKQTIHKKRRNKKNKTLRRRK